MPIDRHVTKFAVDTHHLLLEQAGTKRVTLNLIRELKKRADIELIELSPDYPLIVGKKRFSKVWAHLVRLFWVQIHLPILCYRKKVKFLLSPEFNAPLYTHCKRGVIAHDAHMHAQREFVSSLWFHFYYLPFIEKAIRRADVIFTVSEFAKKQVVELMKVKQEKVVVVYNGVDPQFLESHYHSNIVKDQELEIGNYILFVGTFEARKNIERLIEAFSLVNKKFALKLAIVGNHASTKNSNRSKEIIELIGRLGLNEHVRLCGYISDRDLPALYKGASIIAFPSLHEGFGLPIVEGFASGVPVLTSNICSMPEISDGAALLTDPYSVQDIAEKIQTLLTDSLLRDTLVTAGFERVKQFTWANFANGLTEAVFLSLGDARRSL